MGGTIPCSFIFICMLDDLSKEKDGLIPTDPGPVSRPGRKGATKVFNYGPKNAWVPTLTGPFPNGQANAVS